MSKAGVVNAKWMKTFNEDNQSIFTPLQLSEALILINLECLKHDWGSATSLAHLAPLARQLKAMHKRYYPDVVDPSDATIPVSVDEAAHLKLNALEVLESIRSRVSNGSETLTAVDESDM